MSLFITMADLMDNPCCYYCEGCGLKSCRDERPSPGEEQGICAGCVEAYGPWVGVEP